MKYFIPLFILFFAGLGTLAHAQDRNATLDVFPSQTEIAKGGQIDIAIRQNIRDEWHTYWKNAGDSGEPISIDWTLPQGVSASDIAFPTPKEIWYEPLVNFGFEGQPIYLQTITLDENFNGEEITLEGEAFWLICKEICIPESQLLSLTITVGNSGQSANESIFNQAKQAMPEQVEWDARLAKNGETVSLTVTVPAEIQNDFTDVEIYPYDWGVMKTAEKATADIQDNNIIVFTKTAGDRDFSELVEPRFVIKTDKNSYEIKAKTGGAADVVAASSAPFILIIIFAFLGGIILNLMPCVFPVLSMKALSLVKLNAKERRHAQASGIAYTAGIVVSFLAIALTLISLRAAGATIGWGFQLQNTYVVAALAILLFLIALNFAGFFNISSRFVNLGERFTRGNDVRSSFFTGVLACVVATPCSAPFMASAIGYAMTQSIFIALLVFTVLGLGLAFPYLLLCFIPKVQTTLPKPGLWMETFRQFLAFPMFASVVWLVWVLSRQAGDMAVLFVLAAFLSVSFIIWMTKKTLPRIFKFLVSGLIIILLCLYMPLLSKSDTSNHESFTQKRLQEVLTDNPDRPVFVNMTADWCITCLVNERTSLSNDKVKEAFENHNILYMKGDWTNKDQEITQYLESFQRNGVPLYVFYNKADKNGQRPEAQVLPQILTPSLVIETLKGESTR